SPLQEATETKLSKTCKQDFCSEGHQATGYKRKNKHIAREIS
ncbi:2175_t:CDS:1, partial [Scutellospora calospora]